MKKLLLLFIFLGVSCSTEPETTAKSAEQIVSELTFRDVYIGDWVGRDNHKLISISEHSIAIETEEGVTLFTEGTQMAQTYLTNALQLPNTNYIDFERLSLTGMKVIYKTEDSEIVLDDIYIKQE